MNLAVALHLLRKDMRWRRVDLITLWVLLAIYVLLPLLREPISVSDNGLRWLFFGEYFSVIGGLGLLMSLQIDFVQGDHPRVSEGFLQTRPVGRREFLAAKLLGWFVVAALPALVAVLLSLALSGLDLRMEDYIRVALRNSLVLLGIYGVLSMPAALLLKRRVAMALSLVLMAVLLLLYPDAELLWENLSPRGLQFWTMEESRLIAAWSLTLASGYVLTACALARTRWSIGLVVLVVGAYLCLLARFYWPVNLVWRDDRIVAHDPARLEQLQKLTHLEAGGHLLLGRTFRSTVLITGDSGVEFPEPVAYDATVAFPNGRRLRRAMRPVGVKGLNYKFDAETLAESRLDREGIYPPIEQAIPPEALVRALKLPEKLAQELRNHTASHVVLQDHMQTLVFEPEDVLPVGVPAHVSGRMTLNWVRAEVVGEIPLKAGASFARDGHRVDLHTVSIVDGQLVMRHSVQTCHSLLYWDRSHNAKDLMVLWVVNRARGEIAVSLSPPMSSEWCPFSRIREVQSEDQEVHYTVFGGTGRHYPLEAHWLDDAKLCILMRRHIGQTEQPFEGGLVTHDPRDDEVR